MVNALSSHLEVEVARDKTLYSQSFKRGRPMGQLSVLGKTANRRGTFIRFTPDEDIFGANCQFKAEMLYRMALSKAYLFAGVEIRWQCAPELLLDTHQVPQQQQLCFPGGLADYLNHSTEDKQLLLSQPFTGRIEMDEQKFEWAITWLTPAEDGFFRSYCNTVPTPLGGTHETGFRQAISRGLRNYGDMVGHKRAADLTAEDILAETAGMLSVFLKDPQFQGQTKDKLVTADATRQTEAAVRDRFEIWLSAEPTRANDLLERAIERMEDRKRKRKEKDVARKSATRKLRLPGNCPTAPRQIQS